MIETVSVTGFEAVSVIEEEKVDDRVVVAVGMSDRVPVIDCEPETLKVTVVLKETDSESVRGREIVVVFVSGSVSVFIRVGDPPERVPVAPESVKDSESNCVKDSVAED